MSRDCVALPQFTTSPQPGGSAEPPLHIFDLSAGEVESWLARHNQPRYRAAQVLEWVYRRQAASFDEMTNLGKPLRAALAAEAVIYRSQIAAETVSEDGTRKLLLRWPDGASVEAVWIPAEQRQTACISSQVGCPVGCRFCASGLDGVERNLTAGEIVEQAMRIARLVAEHAPPRGPGKPARLSHIVLMGMGEPLANYGAVVEAIRTLNAEWCMNIGARRITLSTVGLPSQIRKLADEGLPINLALSLHAPDDELRHELIPWGQGVPVAKLLEACRYYFEKTGREITLEYVLLSGVNDEPRHASRLAAIARRLRANVNLLRYNPVPGLDFRRPNSEQTYAFQRLLREAGVNAHVRTSRGRDVQAACGQLRRSMSAD